MPKRIATVSVTVVRDGKRVSTGPGSPLAGKAFDYTDDEIKSVSAQVPTAFRKPVNESDPADIATVGDETTPEKTAKATAAKANKVPAKKKAAIADSTSDEATKDTSGSGEPKDTDGADDADDDAGEDDDI